jgi:hypothetical protein
MTYLNSSRVIDHLASKSADRNVCVAYIYCDYQEHHQQSTLNMAGSLLRQAIVASYKSHDNDTVIRNLLENKQQRQELSSDEALKALAKILGNFDKTYICIDALDECGDQHLEGLIRILGELAISTDSDVTNPSILRLFFTGRPEVEDYVSKHSSTRELSSFSVTLEAVDIFCFFPV